MNRFFTSILTLFICASCCSGVSDAPQTADEVLEISRRVADWQIETYDDQGEYRARAIRGADTLGHNKKYNDRQWQCAAFYAGLSRYVNVDHTPAYEKWLVDMGNKYDWQILTKRKYHADDHAMGMLYLDLCENFRQNKMMAHVKQQFTDIMTDEKRNDWHWTWCDALFMAPPVWTKLAKLTKDQRYLDYMDMQYRMTYDRLWDKEEHLFFRDKSYLDKTEANGEKLFWARGNGWVFGGLALMIPNMPRDWESRDFYINLFKEMAVKVKDIQRTDGTWSSGLLGDEDYYKDMETSGTSFFAYGLAWGILNGYLDRATYEPVMWKAWNALCSVVTPEGMLGYVQPVGAAPGMSFADRTELYGSGAFLAAGGEIYKLAKKYYPVEDDLTAYNSDIQTMMHDGGWCWYQDPRAIINNGKLVIGGINGENGDVRVSVYDLASEKIDGEVVLHEKFEADDHDTPAFYVRPDGSLLAMWAKHAREKAHHYKISSPDNYLEWGEPQKYEHVYDYKSGVTYMNIFHMKDQDKLYTFFRDGLNYNPSFITSDDHGTTWGNRTHFIANDISGRNRPYARYNQIDENTVGVSYTDAHPRDYGNNLYYVEFKDGKFYTVDGTLVHDLKDGAFGTSKGELLYDGSDLWAYNKPLGLESVPNSAWSCATSKDAEGNPHLGYTLYNNNYDHRYRIVSWDGEQWNDREIAYGGNCLYTQESSYTGLMCFDPTDPTNVYISTDVDPSTGEELNGVHQIYSAKIGAKDDISTIKWTAITKNAKERNIRPMVIAGDGYKVLIWLHGDFRHFRSYKMNVEGIVLERP